MPVVYLNHEKAGRESMSASWGAGALAPWGEPQLKVVSGPFLGFVALQ